MQDYLEELCDNIYYVTALPNSAENCKKQILEVIYNTLVDYIHNGDGELESFMRDISYKLKKSPKI